MATNSRSRRHYRLEQLIVTVLTAALPGLSACATTASDRAGYASVNGLRMYYEEHGRGRPLVLIHGGGSTAQTSFGEIIPKLAQTHHVIAPEEQGHGHTADIERPLSFEQMADDTAALLEQLGVGNADILGFSNGGMVALQLAIRHPRLVRRLIVCSSFYSHAGLAPELRQGFDHATVENMPRPLREAYQAVAPHPEALPIFVAKTVAMMKSFPDVPESVLRTIDAPMLVMVGDADVVSPEHAMRLARLVKRGELAVFPGSAHGTYLGSAEGKKPGSPLPDLAVTMIEAFLAGH
jgi:pimeloyl-ACP methyl ester carboxylesterase